MWDGTGALARQRGHSLGDGWNRSLWGGDELMEVQETQESTAPAAL